MKNFLFSSLISLLSLSQPVWGQTNSLAKNLCPAELEPAISAIANRPQFQHSRWGILIETLTTNITLYERDSQYYFIPASTVKLLTTVNLTKIRSKF